MKRLFLAIPIKTTDNEFVPLLDGLKRQLAHEKRINWVKPQHIHLTLKFIGNTPDEDMMNVTKMLCFVTNHTPEASFVTEKPHYMTNDTP